MMFLRNSIIVFCFLVFNEITQLARTNAFIPGLPINYAGHPTIASGKSFYRNISEEERTISFEKIGIRKNGSVTKLSAATTDDDGGTEEGQGRLIGTLVLLTVPLSWGTYVPVGESILCLQSLLQSTDFAHKFHHQYFVP